MSFQWRILILIFFVGAGILAGSVIPAPVQGETSKSGSVADVSDAQFEKNVVRSKRPVLVDFWAPWCGYCRMFSPVVDQLSEDYRDRLKVLRMNVDENPETSRAIGIEGLPTALLFDHGKIVKAWVGFVSQEEMKSYLDHFFDKQKPIKTPEAQ